MQTNDVKVMNLRRDAECACGTFVPRGTRAGWHRELRIVLCVRCLQIDETPTPVDVGVPGASLDREYARRVSARERQVRARHRWIGGMLLRMSPVPHTTDAFRIGAAGEREVADYLTRMLGDQVIFLFNRRRGTGRERGDIDMLAIAPSGVHVIDPKKYAGRRVRADRGRTTFVIDGRRQPALSASMRRQIDVVRSAVMAGPQPTAPVLAAYCFVSADLPLRALVVDGVDALSLRQVRNRLAGPGPLDATARATLHADLARRFPPA